MSRPSQIMKICEACREEFSVHRYRATKARFCSRRCFATHHPHRPPEERFWEKVHKTDSCWLWTGATTPAGYGRFDDDYAHRFALKLAYGPLERGVQGLHKCDNPPCVRVHSDHVFPGTQHDNLIDMSSKARGFWQQHPERARRGSNHPMAKLTELVVSDIFRFHFEGFTGKWIATKVGVSPNTISRVLQGKTWTHVSPNVTNYQAPEILASKSV